MIVLATQPYQGFIDFLNNKRFTEKSCTIVVLPNRNTVSETKIYVFALYKPDTETMYVAGEFPYGLFDGTESREDIQRFMLYSIAHEYIHHIQK